MLGLAPELLQHPEFPGIFAGNRIMPGSEPLAAVYSGHQFGVWAGQLGDGQADRTPYSRGADGRAVLRSSIRELLCSEAMAGLGIPTTRALCVIGADLPIRREEIETAAVVTRVAPGFIRFGSFEHWAAATPTTPCCASRARTTPRCPRIGRATWISCSS